LAWDRVCPPPDGRSWLARGILDQKVPYTMMARLGYPCWAAQGHLYTIDLFNPANELMLPYEEGARRMWAVMPFKARFALPDSVWLDLLQAIAPALRPDYAFGGPWVGPAVIAYTSAGEFRALDDATRLTDIAFQHMIVRAEDLPADGLARLRKGVVARRRTWSLAVCDQFGRDGEYVFLSVAAEYTESNDILGRMVGEVIGKTYVTDLLVKQQA
jgi:hypothetical protein